MGRSRLDPGERAVRWISNLTLSDDFKGKPFRLREWQAEIPRKLFGTFRPDGLRQYRRSLFFIPRKQAKTQLSAAIGVFALLGDRDSSGAYKTGQEIDCAASDRIQAGHLFRKADEMIQADPHLRKQVRVYHSQKKIEAKATGNVLQVLSSDGRRQYGGNPSVLLFDELFTQPNRDLYNALTSGQTTRTEPLNIFISTAGNQRGTLCWDEYKYACDVRDGRIVDPEYLAVVYEAAPDDDWTDEAVWHKAMPALSDFANLDYIRGECKKAKESQSEESKFRQLFLNQWVASEKKWLKREAWSECGKNPVDGEALKGRRAFGGLDLSNTSDITAFVLVFPMEDGSYEVLCWFWIPRAYAEECDRRGHTKYLQWARAGLITLTEGYTIDYQFIIDQILGKKAAEGKPATVGLIDEFDIQKVFIDKYNATQTALKLEAAGLEVEFMRQGVLSMNEPTKFLEVLISRGQLHHGDNEVLNWMADNAVSEQDSQGNVKLSKGASASKIDGMIGLVMAIAAAMVAKPKPKPSVSWL